MSEGTITKKRKLTLRGRRALFGLAFISPWLIGFCAFYVRSLTLTVRMSLSEVGIGAVGGYTLTPNGIGNFLYEFLEHARFKQVFYSSLTNIGVDVPLVIFFSLFMALLLNKKFKGRTLIRAIFFLPVILNSQAIVDAISNARQMMIGGINATSAEIAASTASTVNLDYYISLFRDLALPDRLVDYVVGAVGRINEVITASGVQIVIFIAALQSVQASMYEVAKIEGATAYETFWKVTFPMVMPHIITCVVYTVIEAFANSEIVSLAYDTAFTSQNWGLSAAMSLTSTFVILAGLLLVCWFIQRRTFYYT